MDSNKLFLFHGDSFTWGEGLELENPKVKLFVDEIIKYRKDIKSTNGRNYNDYNYPSFMDLTCDTESLIYRAKNSFTHLVSEYFNAVGVRNQNNGGTNKLSFEKVESLVDIYPNFDFVVIQMTNCLRDIENHPDDMGMIYSNTFGKFYKEDLKPRDYKNFLQGWEIWDRSYKDYTPFNTDIDYFDTCFRHSGKLWDLDFAMKIQSEYRMMTNKMKEIYIFLYKRYCEYIDRIENKLKKKIYIIGSWCQTDFEYKEFNYESEYYKKIHERTIPLKIFNTEVFDSIYELTEKFYYENLYLDDVFPELNNNHPTVKLNKIIADSIISYIEDNKIL